MKRFLLPLLLIFGLLWPAVPAHADFYVDGYVLATQPSNAHYTVTTGYQHNSTGGAVEIVRYSPGVYGVIFVGMAVPNGVAHVQTYGSPNNGVCTVSFWGTTNGAADEVVAVRCFDSTGAAADSKFVASFSNRVDIHHPFGYLWADHPSTSPYLASKLYSFDSTGVAIHVDPDGTGVYRLNILSLNDLYGTPEFAEGHIQVTAYNASAVRCVTGFDDDHAPYLLTVVCRNAQNALTNSKFVLTFADKITMQGIGDIPHGNATVTTESGVSTVTSYWNSGGQPTVTRVATGNYQVKFPALGTAKGNAFTSSQTSSRYCYPASWLASGSGEEVVNVRCYNTANGLAADATFGAAFTS